MIDAIDTFEVEFPDDDFEIAFPGPPGDSVADILRRTGQLGVLPTDTDEQVMAKLAAAPLATVDGLIKSAQRSGTFTDRDAIPLEDRVRGLRFLVTADASGPFQEWREYEWRLAGDRDGPTREWAFLTAPQWCALYTEREKQHFDIASFQGTLPAANVEQLPTVLDNIADLATVGIADFRATALTGGNRPLIELNARLLGLKPDTIKVTYGGAQLTIPGLPWRPKDQAAVKDFFVSGNSIDDATDVPMWHTILAARRGVVSHFTARYSSDKHQLARAGLDLTVLTFAGNTLPAGGTSKLVASLNGNSPIDINADYALLSTGDASLTTGVSLHGVIVDATNSRPGTLSAPNAASAAYSFTQDAGLPAITLSGPVTFIPDLARFPAVSDNFCGIGQNFFYSGVPGAFGDHTALIAYEIIDRFAAAADGNRFLIRDVLPSADWPAEGSPAGPINGVDYGNHQYSAMNAFNARNEARHPGSRARSLPRTGYPNGLTLLQFLQTRGDGSAGANADIAAGLVPRNLRLDGLHPNLAGQTAMADFFDEAMQTQKLATYDLDTSFSLSVTGTKPAIYPDEPVASSANAVAQIELGPIVDLSSQLDGISDEVDAAATLAANALPSRASTRPDLGVVIQETATGRGREIIDRQGRMVGPFKGALEGTATGLKNDAYEMGTTSRPDVILMVQERTTKRGAILVKREGLAFSSPSGPVAALPTHPDRVLSDMISAGAWRGAWVSSGSYVGRDVCFSSGSYYVCHAAVGPSEALPGSDPAHWVLLPLVTREGVILDDPFDLLPGPAQNRALPEGYQWRLSGIGPSNATVANGYMTSGSNTYFVMQGFTQKITEISTTERFQTNASGGNHTLSISETVDFVASFDNMAHWNWGQGAIGSFTYWDTDTGAVGANLLSPKISVSRGLSAALPGVSYTFTIKLRGEFAFGYLGSELAFIHCDPIIGKHAGNAKAFYLQNHFPTLGEERQERVIVKTGVLA